MEFALGILHLPPDAFWAMTLREYDAAIAGHNKFHGGGETDKVDVPRLQASIADMKLLYPDNPP